MSKSVALRTSLIWHDEVMEDVVSEQPTAITIGPSSTSTLLTPEIGLPDAFAIVRPGKRGYLLTLGDRMRGTVCLGGVEHDVAELVRTNGDGGFHATAISGADWGVVELDDTGKYKLFFQFVPLDDQPAFLTTPILAAGLAGYLVSAAVLAGLWTAKGFGLGEATFRGIAIATLALGAAGCVRWLLKQDGEARASLAFSVVLHAALLFTTYQLYQAESPFVWPGPRDLTASYLVSRIQAPPPPAPSKPAIAAAVAPPAPTVATVRPMIPASKLVIPKPSKPKAGEQGVLAPGSQSIIAGVVQSGAGSIDELKKHVDALPGTTDGSGAQPGVDGWKLHPGDPPGNRPRGPKVPPGPPGIDVGPLRKAPGLCVGACGGPVPVEIIQHTTTHDDGIKLTQEQIETVIHSRAGMIKACYQRELNRQPGLAGTIGVSFNIAPSGEVTNTSTFTDSVHDEAVTSCVRRALSTAYFPVSSGGANVKYPFVFSPG